MKAFIFSVSIAFTALFVVTAQAFEIDSSKFLVNGFGTLGLTKGGSDRVSSRNNVAQDGVFDEWSVGIDSRIGLQLDYYPTEKLTFSAQFVAADREKNSLDKSVHSAYIGYKITPSLELKIGRIAAKLLLLSDYKHIGYAQLWAHPSLEFYGNSTADYGDGIALIYDKPLYGGHLRTQAWLNKSEFSRFSEKLRTLEVEPSYGIISTWENEKWTYSFVYAALDFNNGDKEYLPLQNAIRAVEPIWPSSKGLVDDVALDDTTGHYYGFAIGYSDNDWVLRTEFSLSKTKSFYNDTKNAYVLAGRRFNTFTPYISAATLKNERTHIPSYQTNPFLPSNINASVATLQQQLQQYADYFHYDQQTVSLGIRWDVEPKLALKAQWDHTWIGAYGGARNQQREMSGAADTVDRFTVTMDFIF